MRKLFKMVCERCYAMYRGELEEDGLNEEEAGCNKTEGGICSICNRVEGQRTVQFTAAEIAAAGEMKGTGKNK